MLHQKNDIECSNHSNKSLFSKGRTDHSNNNNPPQISFFKGFTSKDYSNHDKSNNSNSPRKSFTKDFTGFSGWKLSKVNGCSSEMVHIWPNVDEAKMCLRGGSIIVKL